MAITGGGSSAADDANASSTPGNAKDSSAAAANSRQIPIVCPGHTRPLAELQFCHVPEEKKTLLVSACHGEYCTSHCKSHEKTTT
jgi:hypothetical protein